MDDLIMPRKKEHPDWIKIGQVGVDSGTVTIGDYDLGLIVPFGEKWISNGACTTVATLFGDGTYDVFVQTDEDGGVERVMVEFGTWE
jgi:hypothetical protein